MACRFPLFNVLRKTSKISFAHRSLSTSHHLSAEKIVIPNRIPRSSTDILQALASTVGLDASGPHYKYHDDPYLTPASNIDKRSFSLSKESGRKAAKYIMNKYSKLFTHQPEDPYIEGFHPKVIYSEETNVSGETIQDLIRTFQLADAITVYEICVKKEIELSDEVRQELLELLCYYNCEGQLDEDLIEERWYMKEGVGGDRFKKTWKDGGLAEEIFQSLSNKDCRAYCALIRGMANYNQVDRAWQLYEKCQEQKISLDTETYNCLIRAAPLLKEQPALRWHSIRDLLVAMAEEGHTPTLRTLNCTLEALSYSSNWRHARNISLETIAEFKHLGIEPSLASYYYLLFIHCRENGPVSHILIEILDYLEGKEFEIHDLKDVHFFSKAMDVCCNHLQSLETAQRLDNLLHTGNNYIFIGDGLKEAVYYRHFFNIMSSSEMADNLMEVYNHLVPHVYTPEPRVMEEILKNINLHEAVSYVPQLWSDIIVFDQTGRENVIVEVLQALTCHQPNEENVKLTEQIITVAWDIWTRIQNENESRRRKVSWTGQMIGNLLTTLVHCGEYSKSLKVMEVVNERADIVLGSVPIDTLKLILDAALQREDASTAVTIVSYAVDVGYLESGEMAKLIASSLKLTDEHHRKLTALLGIDFNASN